MISGKQKRGGDFGEPKNDPSKKKTRKIKTRRRFWWTPKKNGQEKTAENINAEGISGNSNFAHRKEKTRNTKTRTRFCGFRWFFYNKLRVNENAETPRHATAQLRCRVPLELRETKQLLKALPGSTLAPCIVWESTSLSHFAMFDWETRFESESTSSKCRCVWRDLGDWG